MFKAILLLGLLSTNLYARPPMARGAEKTTALIKALVEAEQQYKKLKGSSTIERVGVDLKVKGSKQDILVRFGDLDHKIFEINHQKISFEGVSNKDLQTKIQTAIPNDAAGISLLVRSGITGYRDFKLSEGILVCEKALKGPKNVKDQSKILKMVATVNSLKSWATNQDIYEHAFSKLAAFSSCSDKLNLLTR